LQSHWDGGRAGLDNLGGEWDTSLGHVDRFNGCWRSQVGENWLHLFLSLLFFLLWLWGRWLLPDWVKSPSAASFNEHSVKETVSKGNEWTLVAKKGAHDSSNYIMMDVNFKTLFSLSFVHKIEESHYAKDENNVLTK